MSWNFQRKFQRKSPRNFCRSKISWWNFTSLPIPRYLAPVSERVLSSLYDGPQWTNWRRHLSVADRTYIVHWSLMFGAPLRQLQTRSASPAEMNTMSYRSTAQSARERELLFSDVPLRPDVTCHQAESTQECKRLLRFKSCVRQTDNKVATRVTIFASVQQWLRWATVWPQ